MTLMTLKIFVTMMKELGDCVVAARLVEVSGFKLFDFVMVVLYPDLGASESWLSVSGAAFSTVVEVAFSFSGELILLQKAK